MSSGSHRASAYFLTQTSSTMRDKQWRKRCGSEAKRGKGRARERNPITWDSDAEGGWDRRRKRRERKTLAAAGSAITTAATGSDAQNVAPPPEAAANVSVAHAARKGMTTAMAVEAHKKAATELMTAKLQEKRLAYEKEREQRAKLASGRPPLAERKTALTALKLQQLERAQAQQARRLGMMDASVRSSGRKSGGSRASTSRTTSRASLQSGRTSGRVPSSARSRCGSARSSRSRGRSTARGDETCRSDASWSSKLSIDSQASNLTEKAMSRIIELERALERE